MATVTEEKTQTKTRATATTKAKTTQAKTKPTKATNPKAKTNPVPSAASHRGTGSATGRTAPQRAPKSPIKSPTGADSGAEGRDGATERKGGKEGKVDRRREWTPTEWGGAKEDRRRDHVATVHASMMKEKEKAKNLARRREAPPREVEREVEREAAAKDAAVDARTMRPSKSTGNM